MIDRNINRVVTLLALISCLMGYGYVSGLDALFTPFLCCGIVLCVAVLVATMHRTHDWFNPLSILFATALLRIGLPALLLLFSQPPYDWVWYTLPAINWERGIGLALVGLCSIVAGWLLVPRGFLLWFYGKARRFAGSATQIAPRIGITALLFSMTGLVFTVLFMRMNYASTLQAVSDGSLRNPALVQSGTSRYIFLGQWMLTVGPLAWTAHLLFTRKLPWYQGLLPVICAGLILTPFGGRVGALTPIICGLIVLWYREARRVSFLKLASIVAVLFALVQIYAVFVVLYRGNGVDSAVARFTSEGLREQLEMSIWGEIGILHPYAHATNYEPGILAGKTFPVIIIDNFLGMETLRPGVFLTQEVFSPLANWGIHTGVIVDLYMNVGLATALFGCFCFGAVWRAAYETMRACRRSPNVVVLYTIFLWYSTWIFYESMILLNTLFFALFFAKALYVAARLSLLKPGELGMTAALPAVGGPAPVSEERA